MAPSLKFLKTIRSATRPYLTVGEYVKLKNTVKASAKDIDIPHFGSAIAELEFKNVNGTMHVNNVPFSSVEKHLRAGKLRKFFDGIGAKHVLKEADEIAFKQINPQLPEIKITKRLEAIDRLKELHPDLDVKVKEGMDLEKVLTPKAKSKLSKFWSAINKKPITYVGLFAAIVVGKDMYKSVQKATLNNNGCYLVQHVNGRTIACKVISKSCSSPNSNINKKACMNSQGGHINIALLLLYALKTDAKLKTVLEEKLASNITEATIPLLLSNVESKTVLLQYLKDFQVEIPNHCMYNNSKVFKSNKADCVACNSSVDNSSIAYVDSSHLPDNMSYHCITDSTVLETLADIAIENSINFLDGLVSLASSLFKYLTIAVSVFSFIALVAFIIFSYFNKKNDNYCDENCMRNMNQTSPTHLIEIQ